MELLQHLIDSDKSAQSVFDTYADAGMDSGSMASCTPEHLTTGLRGGNSTSCPPKTGIRKNVNVDIPTLRVLQSLQEDETFYPNLLEYLRYEQEITDFGVELHIRQRIFVSAWK